MSARSGSIIQWLAVNAFPFERDLRMRLRRAGSANHEIDDIVQEAYLQLMELPDVDHIRDGRAYLFATAQSVLLNRIRHERVVRIDQLGDRVAWTAIDDTPSPERRTQARQELARAVALIRQLPQRCRQVFELRRIEGMSRRAIAEQLGMSEDMVAYEASRGLRMLIAATMRADDPAHAPHDRHPILRRLKRGRPRK